MTENVQAPLLTITGPTAVGKTALSIEVARRVNGEIISADSRQVYRELTIGTAKPEPHELAAVPHHFIGERTLGEPFSAGTFADEANQRIRQVLERGRTPIVVGGSTLYLHALQYGLADIPDVPDEVRSQIEARMEDEGAEALYAELEAVDPKQAAKMDPTKTHRLIRALEVYHGTGRPLSYYYEHQPTPPFDYRTIVLHRERARLYERIERRVDRMLKRGLLDEVQAVKQKKGIDLTTPPLKTIGYKEPIRYLEGEYDYDEMVRLMKRNSRRYAKRQLTWFRRYDEYEWMEAASVTVDRLFSKSNLQ